METFLKNMSMNKKYSIDKGGAQTPYISPELKVIEMTARNAILSESSWSTGEDGTPKTPVW